ncbi:glutamate racemase, partial [bacterium]
ATFQGRLYASVVERFANGVTILQDTVPGLVTAIENGQLDAPETRAILEAALKPMLAKNIDTVVLGCTHFPFVIPLIQQIAGPGVRVIDPAPAVARQTARLLEARGWLAAGDLPAQVCYFTTGAREPFEALLHTLIGVDGVPAEKLRWSLGKLRA